MDKKSIVCIKMIGGKRRFVVRILDDGKKPAKIVEWDETEAKRFMGEEALKRLPRLE